MIAELLQRTNPSTSDLKPPLETLNYHKKQSDTFNECTKTYFFITLNPDFELNSEFNIKKHWDKNNLDKQ